MTSLDDFRGLLTEPAVSAHTFRAVLVDLGVGEQAALHHVCREHHVAFHDPIERQLEDWTWSCHPASSDGAARRTLRDRKIEGAGDMGAVGCWAYFPWLRSIVHVLDRDAYYEVITNRNRDKLTKQEQDTLRSKRIGVLGLSVGGEAAVTVAQEHLCGSIALADFDALELSNLNRLNAGVDELGENKACLVARRIARIDPFLDVSVYAEGVTHSNADAFLDGLDLLIEECDHLPVKHDIRRLAKARGLNVVYAADERGFLSVEPYAQRADLEPFHGRVQGPQPERDDFDSPLELMKALTEWLGGWEHISARSRSSLERLGVTTVGYPQLASEARYAAGQVGHIARRLLLGENVPPFAGYLDLEELVRSDG